MTDFIDTTEHDCESGHHYWIVLVGGRQCMDCGKQEYWAVPSDLDPTDTCPHETIVDISEDGLSMCLSCGRTWDEAVRS